MSENSPPGNIDWSLTSWEGACREQLRRWAELPLEDIVAALEEMEALAQSWSFEAKISSEPGVPKNR
jgi:hypothetical protein